MRMWVTRTCALHSKPIRMSSTLREAFSYDVRRYTAMIRSGWLVARFTWDDVMHRPVYVAAVVADLVARDRS